MRLYNILQVAGLPTLVFAGFGVGAAVADFGVTEVPEAIAAAPHCMAANLPSQGLSPEAIKAYEEADPPLWNDLGSLTYPISTKNSEAQSYFQQGLRQTANFNHAEARRAFGKAQRLDPSCAMCFLGEALVLGPNINVPMDPAANAPAIAALKKAQALASGASEKERELIEAVATRYSEDPAAERPKLDASFADAMAALSDKYPDDLELAVLAAEAAMDTQPWDYWEPGGKEPKGRTADVQKRLEGVLAKAPDHPWAIHLYIHLVEASDRPERAEPYADRLAALMPGAGHIVHMPSHIYYRIGRYADSLEANKAASKADETYIAQTGAVGVYPIGYYSHNVHFVLGLGAASRRRRDRARRSRQTRQVAEQRRRDSGAHCAACEGSPVFRMGAICRPGHGSGHARPARRAALCEGDVALCQRDGIRGQEGRGRRTHRGRCHSPHRPGDGLVGP
ncbi:hypothetical protein MesoLjLc_57210 [Mesorhizobium sp. L-8-10]|nr:hypothetical protein MesoLjLc_57210 [Mesorhizobium sp. L-8-10]